MPLPGSTDLLTLTVTPSDVTTLATVTVTSPDGLTVLTPSATSADHETWTASPVYTQTGKWVAEWIVTGTGSGVVAEEIWVSQLPSPTAGVAWRPDLWKVADNIPGRTLVGAVDGYGNALNTFSSATHPTDAQVQRLITDACAWVMLKTGPVDPTLYDAASSLAALFAAARVELTWPDNRDDLNTADQLYRQAVAMRDDLWRANEAVTGVDVEDPEAHLMPVYSFPLESVQSPWGDVNWL